jgi:hypothetical protein
MNKKHLAPRAERRATAKKMRKDMGIKKSFRDFWQSFQTVTPVGKKS